MRIGIITVPFNNNYGGYLQAYALMTVLKRMGHEPTMIMRRHNHRSIPLIYRIKFFVSGIIKTIWYQKKYPLIYTVETNFRYRGKKMLEFVDKHITPQTIYIYSTKDLKRICKDKFDAYIVGSDQVWRAIYVPGIVGNMFLDFTEGWKVKRVAYAASFGTKTPEYTDEEKEICGKLIERFNAISLREVGGLNVFNNFNWKVKDTYVVLDPTMLLTFDDYNKILPQEPSEAKGKIFCYVLDKTEEAMLIISNVQKQLKKEIFEISDIQRGGSILPSIETWLSAIRDADYVITDSFHGTVFSIIFRKQFLVNVNKERGADRLKELLTMFGLQNYISDKYDSIKNIIDYSVIAEKTSILRNESIEFIKKSL